MDEMRRARLEVYADSECGLIAQSRLIHERAGLLRERAVLAIGTAAILCERAHAVRISRPPAWIKEALEDLRAR